MEYSSADQSWWCGGVRVDRESKPYGKRGERCDYCGSSGEPQQHHEAEKSLSRSEHLKKHQQRPTGKKSHFCADCGKDCKSSSELKINQQVHTGEPDITPENTHWRETI